MERVGHEGHGTGVPYRGADGDRLLRRLFPRLRRLRPRAKGDPAQDPDSRREAERHLGCGGHACFGAESGRQNSDVGRTEESVESDILVIQHLL